MEGWSFNQISIIFFSAAGSSILIAYLAWMMQTVKSSKLFSIMMMAVAVWIIAYTLNIYCNDPDLKMFFLKIEFMGKAVAIYLWLIFVAQYTSFHDLVKKTPLVILAIVPVYTIVSAILAPHSVGFISKYYIEQVKGLTVLEHEYAFGFYVWASYAYCAMGGGAILMVLRMVNMPYSQRMQSIWLSIAMLVIIFSNVIYVFKINPIHPYEPTPISLALVGGIFLLTMFRHKFLDVMPIAYNQVITGMRSGLVVLNPKDIILEINPIAEDILNCSQAEVIGENIMKVLPESSKLLCNNPDTTEATMELKLEKNERSFDVILNNITNGEGELVGKSILFYDQTKQQDAIRELKAYARTVAHDLKNPLNTILLSINVLELKTNGKNELQVYMEGISNSVYKMTNIVEGLLLLSQVRDVKNVEVCNLNMLNLCQASIERLKSNILEKEVQLVFKEPLFNAYGYAVWVEEVWMNLLSNAIKFGGPKQLIEIGSSLSNNRVRYYVKDQGIGISEEEQKTLFVEFNRQKRHKKTKDSGYGLGLSIVKRIITRLGGEVGVESKPNQGSTFYFTLPHKQSK